MTTQKYAVNQYSIQTLLTWVETEEIAIPEIQRPFVWEPVKVRNLLDSLLQGYPVGYLIAWRNPNVKLKDGSTSAGKRILIDGQQRVTALRAALLGKEVVNHDYETVRIKIAYHPLERRFEVSNPAIEKDVAWIPDVSSVFSKSFEMFSAVNAYCLRNPEAKQDDIFKSIEALRAIVHNHVGLIELDSDLDIETVTEIFIRVNSAGTELSQADFVMSKIATNEKYHGPLLRKAIDYFCHMAVAPDFYSKIEERDKEFVSTEFFPKMSWLREENDDIYDPSYTDMLRVAFASEFKRGKLADLVALLSGRNFETKQYEESIVEQSFSQLRRGIFNYINETNFKRFVMIIRSAGFVDPSLISSQNALNVAYIIYLTLRSQSKPAADIEHAVRKWFVMSLLTGRYSGSTESMLDYDIRQIHLLGFDEYFHDVEAGVLSETYWKTLLPQEMNTSASFSPFFRTFLAAQVKLGDNGFLSRDITVRDLLTKSDIHHIFPRNYLKKLGFTRFMYNQIANYVITQSEINIAIGDTEPAIYFRRLEEQVAGGKVYYGGITDPGVLEKNFQMNCIPQRMEMYNGDSYQDFLEERRKLMAAKIREFYYSL